MLLIPRRISPVWISRARCGRWWVVNAPWMPPIVCWAPAFRKPMAIRSSARWLWILRGPCPWRWWISPLSWALISSTWIASPIRAVRAPMAWSPALPCFGPRMPPLQSQAGGFVRRPLDFCHDEALEATGSHPVFTAGCDGWLNSRH